MIDHKTLKLAMEAYHRDEHASPEDAMREALAAAFNQSEFDEDEAYEIGKRDGYEKAVQDIDVLTGGDGEYCCSTADPERHVPDAAAMKERIRQRMQGNKATFGELSPAANDARKQALEVSDELIKACRNSGPSVERNMVAQIIAKALMDRDARASRIALKHAKPHAKAYTRRRMKKPYPVTARPMALQAIRISREILNKQSTEKSDF